MILFTNLFFCIMKKLYFVLSLTIFVHLQLFCNPLPAPIYLKISEFKFNADNTWELELVDDLLFNDDYRSCDSLFICSSTGRAKLKDVQQNDQCLYPTNFLITQDDLFSPLYINEEGDSITIVHFCCNGREDLLPKTVLTFGNYPNAMIEKPAEGESIVAVDNVSWDHESEYCYSYYSKNNNPSLGVCDKNPNNMSGSLRGKIYDDNGEPMCNQVFLFFYSANPHGVISTLNTSYYKSKTDNEGNYNLDVYANTLILDTIYLSRSNWIPYVPYILYERWAAVNFVQMEVAVGDVIDWDIHITGPILSSPKLEVSNNPVKLYPNPIEQGAILNYEIDLPVVAANIELEMVSLTGQQLFRKKVTNNTGIIDLQKEIPGIYIINCIVNGKNLYSTRIIIDK